MRRWKSTNHKKVKIATDYITSIHSTKFLDYSTGFGGKFGVQKDRVDKSAVGWEHHEKVEKHESQKGMIRDDEK